VIVKRLYIAKPDPSSPPIVVKHRFSKKYRHAALDTSLTRQRVKAESRALERCAKAGINVPEVKLVDPRNGLLGLEFIEGKSVRQVLPGGFGDESDISEDEEQRAVEGDSEITHATARGLDDSMHEFGVSHG
jgi:TP53 regulating kinase-like protein